ncbi:MAG: hypothetical protein MJA29_12905 [Candidatus Omnitrophica bacterium]|nr:hypothetical protein [Candidatus Omnitrophota bacterium]
MKKALWAFVVAALCGTAAYAQEYYSSEDIRSEYEQPYQGTTLNAPAATAKAAGDDTVGPGMEVKNVGGVNVIVPRGARVHKEGSKIVFEDMGEYIGRVVDELQSRLERIEQEMDAQREEIEELKRKLRTEPGVKG